jgi:hypothetical protein
MFLVNSRNPHFSATLLCLRRKDLTQCGHTFSRSYGVILPSSLASVLSRALGYSPRPPESVYGTVAIDSTAAFLGSMGSPSCRAEAPTSSPLGLNLAFVSVDSYEISLRA